MLCRRTPARVDRSSLEQSADNVNSHPASLMHPLPVPGSHEYVMRTAGSVDQSVAPPHGRRSGQSTPRNTDFSHPASRLFATSGSIRQRERKRGKKKDAETMVEPSLTPSWVGTAAVPNSNFYRGRTGSTPRLGGMSLSISFMGSGCRDPAACAASSPSNTLHTVLLCILAVHSGRVWGGGTLVSVLVHCPSCYTSRPLCFPGGTPWPRTPAVATREWPAPAWPGAKGSGPSCLPQSTNLRVRGVTKCLTH